MTNDALEKLVKQQAAEIDKLKRAMDVLQKRVIMAERQATRAKEGVRTAKIDIAKITSTLRRG